MTGQCTCFEGSTGLACNNLTVGEINIYTYIYVSCNVCEFVFLLII